MNRKTIPIQTNYGCFSVKVAIRKWLAVHRCWDDYDYWVVTHTPTGCQIPGYFPTKREAIAASKVARRVFPYPLNRESAPTQKQWFQFLENNQIKFVN